MELKIYSPLEDDMIKSIEWNHEEIKQEVRGKMEFYKNLVYTDDQMKDAKKEVATLRKFVQAFDSERKRMKKKCMEPYEAFEEKVKEIMALVQEPILLIDSQIKEYENEKKRKKMEQIKELFSVIGFQPFVGFDHVFDSKWLNASVTMKKIEEQLNEEKLRIGNDVAAINALPEFSFEALEEYKRTLDIGKAIQEGQRLSDIAKRKAEYEAAKAQRDLKKEEPKREPIAGNQVHPKPETGVRNPEDRQEISFRCWLTVEDAVALKEFFTFRNIRFEKI